MTVLILSDIHANVSAFNSVLKGIEKKIDRFILLGDHIDYGMRPNETISILSDLQSDVIVNIWGNHEKAIFDGDLSRFSNDRGRNFSMLTSGLLSDTSKDYISKSMNNNGVCDLVVNNKKILCVHGSLNDVFWKAINYNDILNDEYSKYDYVLSGHSHIPHYFEKYYSSLDGDTQDIKKTVFINPGAVGQPRNHNPRACYAILDIRSGSVYLNNVEYDVDFEQSLYDNRVDVFYKSRLSKGI